ncbi:MAG: DUF4399 domain-containing protein [Pseudomonadota bacterium]
MKSFANLVTAAVFLASTSAFAQDTPAPDGAEVYFVNLEDGATVSSPVTVIFGLAAMGVAPAGTEKENTGHHHLLLNRPPLGQGEDGAEEFEYGLPADDNHIHFGGGQTQVTLDLPAGQHTMQLVMGDLNHVPHATPITSDVITITVE